MGCQLCISCNGLTAVLSESMGLRLCEYNWRGCAEQPGEGARELPEAAQALRAQQAAPPAAEEHEEEELVQGAAGHKVLPDDRAGLGGSRTAGMSAGLHSVWLADCFSAGACICPFSYQQIYHSIDCVWFRS